MPATDAVPLAVLSPRHLVLRRLDLEMSGNASRSPSGIAIDAPARVQSAAQQGLSADDCVASLNAWEIGSRIGATSDVGCTARKHIPAPDGPVAGMETPGAFTESRVFSMRFLPSASKAIATLAGPWNLSQSSDQERAATGVSIAVIEANDARMKEVNHARLAAFPTSKRETRENQGEPAEGRANPLVAKALLLSSRSSASPDSTVRLTDPRNIVAPERSQVSEMQRQSEPQEIADEIDNLIPFVRRNFEASNGIDQEEQAILDGLEEVSNRSIRYAEVIDLTVSMIRVGTNKRNNRRIRELFPEFDPAA